MTTTRQKDILVVEDEADALNALRWMLETTGYKVYTASTAEEGFRFFQAYKPQTLLIDYKLPGASGAQFLQWVKSENPDVRAIMVTGLSVEWDLIESACRGLGAFACLRKPLKPDELLQTIQEAVKKRSS